MVSSFHGCPPLKNRFPSQWDISKKNGEKERKKILQSNAQVKISSRVKATREIFARNFDFISSDFCSFYADYEYWSTSIEIVAFLSGEREREVVNSRDRINTDWKCFVTRLIPSLLATNYSQFVLSNLYSQCMNFTIIFWNRCLLRSLRLNTYFKHVGQNKRLLEYFCSF